MYSLPQSYNQTSKCKRCISSNAYNSGVEYNQSGQSQLRIGEGFVPVRLLDGHLVHGHQEPDHRQHRGNERYTLDCIETPKDGRTVPNQADGHPDADYQTLRAVQERQAAVQHRFA